MQTTEGGKASSTNTASIAILGGSGFYSLADDLKTLHLNTPFGDPSSPLQVGRFAGKQVAFLARHGNAHEFPAHTVPYRANLWALHSIGVTTLISTFSCGSLQAHIAPGEFVMCDQVVDRTHGRASTFYDGPTTFHSTFADPYCQELRSEAAASAEALDITIHPNGTVVVIEGPRFSSKAESKIYSDLGGDVINMTQMPEAALASELGMCFAGIALVTDYDAGISAPTAEAGSEAEPVTHEQVLETFRRNIDRVHSLVGRLVENLPDEPLHCCGIRKGPPLPSSSIDAY